MHIMIITVDDIAIYIIYGITVSEIISVPLVFVMCWLLNIYRCVY